MKPRKFQALAIKLQAIFDYVAGKATEAELCRKLNVTRGTVKKWVKNEESIEFASRSNGRKLTCHKGGKTQLSDNQDQELLDYVREHRSQGLGNSAVVYSINLY